MELIFQLVLLFTSLGLVFVVLLQSGKSNAGSMFGGNEGLGSTERQEVFLEQCTMVFGVLFFGICLVLAKFS